jgi:hypothetical protein
MDWAMASVYDTLCNWTRRKTTSFVELRFGMSERPEPVAQTDCLIYRLKHWPDLPSASRTADVLRTLSVMSHRPVNRHWMLTHSKLGNQGVDRLLARLVRQDAVEAIDPSNWALRTTAASSSLAAARA